MFSTTQLTVLSCLTDQRLSCDAWFVPEMQAQQEPLSPEVKSPVAEVAVAAAKLIAAEDPAQVARVIARVCVLVW